MKKKWAWNEKKEDIWFRKMNDLLDKMWENKKLDRDTKLMIRTMAVIISCLMVDVRELKKRNEH